jgi:hypothetical protein
VADFYTMIDGLGTPPVDFVPVVPGDFIDLATPFTDPNNIVNGPLVVHPSNGIVTASYVENPGVIATQYERLSAFRMKFPPGFRGDGSQTLVARFTPQGLPVGNIFPSLWLGMASAGGNNTVSDGLLAGVRSRGQGINEHSGLVTFRSSWDGGGSAPDSEAPYYIGSVLPLGPSGDNTLVGNSTGYLGTVTVAGMRTIPSVLCLGGWHKSQPEERWQNGTYVILALGTGQTGSDTGTYSVKVEWGLWDWTKAGVFGPPP